MNIPNSNSFEFKHDAWMLTDATNYKQSRAVTVGVCYGHGCGKALCVLDEALLLLPQELDVACKVADAHAGFHLRLPPWAAAAERVIIPAVDSGLAATAADDGVAATTTTSCLGPRWRSG